MLSKSEVTLDNFVGNYEKTLFLGRKPTIQSFLNSARLFVYEHDGVGGHAGIASVAGVGVGRSSSGPRPAVLS